MSTFIERNCLYERDPFLKRDKKSKAIELLKFRQCMNSCCAKAITSKFGEELIERNFATTFKEKASRERKG